MCSSPLIVGGGGGGGVRPSSVETDESIVSRSPEADHDPSDDQDPSDRLLDQILREHGGGAIAFGNAVQSYELCFEEPPFQSKVKSKKAEGSLCRVCGDEATGMYFGALVCVPCKTFYLRYAGSNQNFSCKEKRCCSITVASRTNCKFCRYQKCLRVGMHRKERPCQVHVADGQQVCSVCQDVANGVHFGVITCEGCKKFFRRGLVENPSYVCKNNGHCEVNPRTRNACRFCRYQKCLQVGMSREAIQMGRPSKPRFDKDSSSRESFGLSALAPFDSPTNRLSRKQQTDGRENFSPVHLSINSAHPPSHPVSTHTINNHCSMPANSSGYSSEKGGFQFPALQKMQPNHGQWDLGEYQRQQQQATKNVCPSASGLWSSIEALNGGEMISMTIAADRISPKHELELLDCDAFAEADGEGCCFEMDASDGIGFAEQPIPNEYLPDELSHLADDVGQLLWPKQLSSSQQAPVTVDLLISSSPSTNSLANGCSGLNVATTATSFYGRNDHETIMSPSLPTNALLSLETPTAGDDAAQDAEDAMAVAAAAGVADTSKTSGRRMTELQFPFKSMFKIVHSSVANELPDTQHCHIPLDIEALMRRFRHYWSYDETGEDPFIVHYSNIYQEVIAAYKTFVIHSQYVNFLLRSELEKCQSASNYNIVDVQWIQDNVVPFYVELSIRYCRQLPGFSSFDLSDQQMLIRLGQSPSRILAAAIHWYRPDKRDFGDFLSWRQNDQFKRMMVEHAAKIHALDLDLVEASLLNAALIIATDYPNLVNREPIERQHQDLLAAYKTYTTGKLGTPNDRFQTVIGHMRRVRHLGFIHYEMTKTKNMMAEDVTQLR